MNNPTYLLALGLLAAALTTTSAQAQTAPADSARRSAMTNGRADRRFDQRSNDDRNRNNDRNSNRNQANDNQRGPGRPDDGDKHRHGGPGDMGDHRRGDGRAGGLTALTTVSGTVGQLTGNDDTIFDGFTLTGTPSVTAVSFAPHLGQQVQRAIKPGTAVSVTGFADRNRDGNTRFRLISLTAGKTTVLDAPPVRPATPPTAPTMTTLTGKIADYRIDRRGQVNGLVMSDNTVVQVPPHVAYQLTNLATKGTTVTVQGYARPLREGQVQLRPVTILRASVLTINGQQYLVR
jgi:hypothetical protein